MSGGKLVDVLVVVVVVVMGTERVREAHQPAQGASELGVRRMLKYPTVHARPGCGGAEVKMQREAVWLNMQSKKQKNKSQGEEEEAARRRKRRWRWRWRGPRQADSRLPRPRYGLWRSGGDRAVRGISRLRSSRDVNPALSLREPAH